MRVETRIRSGFLAGSAVLLWPLWAAAAPPSGRAPGWAPDFREPAPPETHGTLEDARPPPFLTGLTLTDEQQDRVFVILHAAAPALREQSKAARKARDALSELVKSGQLNDNTAAALAQSLGKAESQLALLRTRRDHDVYGVLTSEQITRITTREQEWPPRRSEGPPRP